MGMFDLTNLHTQPAAAQIGRLHITPDVPNWSITVEAFINGSFLGTTLVLCLVLGKTIALQLSGPVEHPHVPCTFELPDPGPTGREQFFWTPERPVFFDLTLTLRRDTTILHTLQSYTALRRDGQPFLNGRSHTDLNLFTTHPAPA
jgi:hypothetical protein